MLNILFYLTHSMLLISDVTVTVVRSLFILIF